MLVSHPFLRRALDNVLVSGAMRALESFESRRPNLLRVLTYHRVRAPEAFERCLDHVGSRYRVIDPAELIAAVRGDLTLTPRSMLLTFDDAYKDFAEVVWPRLRARGMTALLFVPTAYPGDDQRVFWWDRVERAFDRTERRDAVPTPAGRLAMDSPRARRRAYLQTLAALKRASHDDMLEQVDALCAELGGHDAVNDVLGWDDLRALSRDGVRLGTHTCTHPLLDRVAPELAQAEIEGAQDDFRRELGAPSPYFAYPGGHFNAQVRQVLSATGVEVAFTSIRGTNDIDVEDPLRLRRIDVGPYATPGVARARLLESVVSLNARHPIPDRTS